MSYNINYDVLLDGAVWPGSSGIGEYLHTVKVTENLISFTNNHAVIVISGENTFSQKPQ